MKIICKKYFLLFTSMMLLYSCKQTDKTQHKVNPLLTDNEQILGRWKMCSSMRSGMMIQYNVCPTITFSESGILSVSFEMGKTEAFAWALKRGKLFLKPYLKGNENTFADSTYSVSFRQKDSLIGMQLSGMSDEITFYLSR